MCCSRRAPFSSGSDTVLELFSHRNKEEFVAYLEDLESSAPDEHLALVEQVYGRT